MKKALIFYYRAEFKPPYALDEFKQYFNLPDIGFVRVQRVNVATLEAARNSAFPRRPHEVVLGVTWAGGSFRIAPSTDVAHEKNKRWCEERSAQHPAPPVQAALFEDLDMTGLRLVTVEQDAYSALTKLDQLRLRVEKLEWWTDIAAQARPEARMRRKPAAKKK